MSVGLSGGVFLCYDNPDLGKVAVSVIFVEKANEKFTEIQNLAWVALLPLRV